MTGSFQRGGEMNTTKSLIAAGNLRPNGYDYETDDGRVILRIYAGRRGTTTRWRVEGDPFLYRDLWCAYHGLKY